VVLQRTVLDSFARAMTSVSPPDASRGDRLGSGTNEAVLANAMLASRCSIATAAGWCVAMVLPDVQ
jgi:hypothetical protein